MFCLKRVIKLTKLVVDWTVKRELMDVLNLRKGKPGQLYFPQK